jgi:mannose-6-phosphate isomerase-like protein (cupin superfamily)
MTLGILTRTEDARGDGEVHPDGGEILHVITGRVRVTGHSAPGGERVLEPDDTCTVPRGEWHKVMLFDETRRLPITPGPNGDHRPLASHDEDRTADTA